MGEVGAADCYRALLAKGAKDATLPWVVNHFRWIVWKLASYERRAPHYFGGRLLRGDVVQRQLEYRYERELARMERPVLRRILEQDQAPSVHMVLCISGILHDGTGAGTGAGGGGGDAGMSPARTAGEKSSNSSGGTTSGVVGVPGSARVEVTDGWYAMEALLDPLLTAKLHQGHIAVGTKLRVFGATIKDGGAGGSVEGIPPLDIRANSFDDNFVPSSGPVLGLHYNGTRRVAWHTRLGLQGGSLRRSKICSVVAGGGLVPAMAVVVKRRYPMLYVDEREERGGGREKGGGARDR